MAIVSQLNGIMGRNPRRLLPGPETRPPHQPFLITPLIHAQCPLLN